MNISFSKINELPENLVPGRIYFTSDNICIAMSETEIKKYIPTGNQSITEEDITEIRNKISNIEEDLEAFQQGLAYVSDEVLTFRSLSASIENNTLII